METYGAKTLFEELKNGVFSDVNVALIYGKMKAKEKSEIMQSFEAGDIDVLIATTVVEVGIDIKTRRRLPYSTAKDSGLRRCIS